MNTFIRQKTDRKIQMVISCLLHFSVVSEILLLCCYSADVSRGIHAVACQDFITGRGTRH